MEAEIDHRFTTAGSRNGTVISAFYEAVDRSNSANNIEKPSTHPHNGQRRYQSLIKYLSRHFKFHFDTRLCKQAVPFPFSLCTATEPGRRNDRRLYESPFKILLYYP